MRRCFAKVKKFFSIACQTGTEIVTRTESKISGTPYKK